MSETHKYIETVGRRKTAIARARITPSAKSSYSVNDKSVEDYFKVAEQRDIVMNAMAEAKIDQKFAITIMVKGCLLYTSPSPRD